MKSSKSIVSKLKIIRCKILVFLTHHLGLPLLRVFRKPKPFPWTKEQLLQMEVGTMGRELVEFIESKNIELLVHYSRHDLKHIVLGFDTTEEGELCLQSFMLGNGRVSFPVLATVLFGLCTAPEYWKAMRLSFKQGKNCVPIHHWDWFSLIPEQTAEIRNKIFNHKIIEP